MKKIPSQIQKNGYYFASLQKTALFDYHKEVLKAKMTPFSGFDMPLQYPMGILKEHLHCREHASFFDVSHMGQLKIYGKDRESFIERATPVDFRNMKDEDSSLSLILNEKAGIIDDCIVTKFQDHVHMVLNAGNKDIDLAHFQALKEREFSSQDVHLEAHFDRSLIAIQGPKAFEILQPLVNFDIQNLTFMKHVYTKIGNFPVQLSRCGYTGEDGFEISVDTKDIIPFCDLIFKNDHLQPAGLGARDSLRLEAGLCLHGNDISENTTPAEALLMWTVRKIQKNSEDQRQKYIGQEYLEANKKTKQKRIGYTTEGKGIIRAGAIIQNELGETVGKVTSGSFGPTLQKGVGMGYVDIPLNKVGQQLKVNLRGKELGIQIEKMPLVHSNYHK